MEEYGFLLIKLLTLKEKETNGKLQAYHFLAEHYGGKGLYQGHENNRIIDR